MDNIYTIRMYYVRNISNKNKTHTIIHIQTTLFTKPTQTISYNTLQKRDSIEIKFNNQNKHSIGSSVSKLILLEKFMKWHHSRVSNNRTADVNSGGKLPKELESNIVAEY